MANITLSDSSIPINPTSSTYTSENQRADPTSSLPSSVGLGNSATDVHNQVYIYIS